MPELERKTFQPAPDISQRAMDFVGLTPQKYAEFQTEADKEYATAVENLLTELQKGEQAGKDLHRVDKAGRYDHYSVSIPGTDLEIDIPISLQNHFIPNYVLTRWEKFDKRKVNEQARREGNLSETEFRINEAQHKYVLDIVRGFGKDAFLQMSWKTAIWAFDRLSHEYGGVWKNEDFLTLIGELPSSKNDHGAREHIARELDRLTAEKEESEAKRLQEAEEAQARTLRRKLGRPQREKPSTMQI